MFSFEDLFVSFCIAIVLIFLFKLQRELSPRTYFSMSDIINGVESSPTRMDVIIRILIIFTLGIVCNFFVDDPNIIVLGLTMGSFLIVWPAFLNEENINPRVINKKFLLYTLLILFVLSTFFISKLSIFAYNLGNEIFKIYIHEYSITRLITVVIDNLLWMLFTFVIAPLIKAIRKNLDKEINPIDNIYEENFYSESAVTIEDENEDND